MPFLAISRATADILYAALGHDHSGTYLEGLSEGLAVSGATANGVLYADASGNLASDGPTFDGTSLEVLGTTAATIQVHKTGSNVFSLGFDSIGGGQLKLNSTSAFLTYGFSTYIYGNGTVVAAGNGVVSMTATGRSYGLQPYVSDAWEWNSSSAIVASLHSQTGLFYAGDLYSGNGTTSATPANGLLSGTGGSGTDIQGGTLYIAPGQSTGSKTPASVVIQSTSAGVSGSALQTLADTLTVTDGSVTIDVPTLPLTYPSVEQITISKDGTPIVKVFQNYDSAFTGPGLVVGSGVFAEAVNGNTYIGRGYNSPSRITFMSGYGAYLPSTQVWGWGNDTDGIRNAYSAWPDTGFSRSAAGVVRLGDGTASDYSGTFIASTIGVNTTAPDKQVEINSVTGDCLRLTYNDADGSAANYTDFSVSSAGDLTITPSGGTVVFAGSVCFATETSNTPTGTTQTVDWSSGNKQLLDLTSASGAVTVTFTDPSGIGGVELRIKQPATALDITWPSSVLWGDTDGEPTWTDHGGKVVVIGGYFDGTNYYMAISDTYTLP